MDNHFKYLADDASRSFFQKHAEEVAAEDLFVPAKPAVSFAKTAGATGFAKIASVIDRDMEVLASAGPVGTNLGMSRRAARYLDKLATDWAYSEAEFMEVFDKVAGAAIEADFVAAEAEFCRGATPELSETMRTKVAEAILGLVKGANVITGALEGAENLAHAGKGLEAVEGAAHGAESAKAVKPAVVGIERGRIGKAVDWAKNAPGAAMKGLRAGWNEVGASMSAGKAVSHDAAAAKHLESAEKSTSAAGKAYHNEMATKFKDSAEAARSKGIERMDKAKGLANTTGKIHAENSPAGNAFENLTKSKTERAAADAEKATAEASKAATPPAAAKGEEPSRAKTVMAPPSAASPRAKTEAAFAENQAKAGKSTAPPEAKASTPEKAKEPAGEAEGETKKPEEEPDPGPMHETAKKMMSGKRMTSKEHMQLLKGGLVGVGAHRVLTGRDVLSGDKN